MKGYDEPEILPSQIAQFCLIGADAGQYTEVLAAMADLGLRPYMAPLTGPNAEQSLAAMQILRDKITPGRKEET